MKYNNDEIMDFAEKLFDFFNMFDAVFLYDETAPDLLRETMQSLTEKVSFNESALPVIMAMGGQYDSGIDRAKIDELAALVKLLDARKAMREATVAAAKRNANNALLLSVFGV